MMDKISGFSGVNRRGNIFKLITALKQICNHPYQFLKSGGTSKELSGKAEKCISLVQNIIDSDEKTLIFTQYKEMGDLLSKIISEECATDPSFFHGSLTVPQRENLIEDFQNNKDFRSRKQNIYPNRHGYQAISNKIIDKMAKRLEKQKNN